MKTDLTKPIDTHRYFRAGVATGLKAGKDAIDREGGDYGAGVIYGVAILTRGEALGHGMWVDREMLEQTHNAVQAAGKNGVKARFTHPGLSSDGLGSYLGRFKNSQDDGDVIRADIHFQQAAHEAPDGDLAGYVMNLADQDPEAFGTSIVFRRDRDAEQKHQAANTKDGRFNSPDADNKEHLPHARLKQLLAVDTVDSPAANPNGLFHRQEIGPEAEALVSFALGLTSEKPELSSLSSIDPDRVSGFVSSFLDRHGLAVVPKEPNMTTETKPNDQPQSFSAADIELFTKEFGADGPGFLLAGKSLEQAKELFAAKQTQADLAAKDAELKSKDEQLTEATKERDELKAKLAALNVGGEAQPASFSGEGEKGGGSKFDTSLGQNLSKYAGALKLRE